MAYSAHARSACEEGVHNEEIHVRTAGGELDSIDGASRRLQQLYLNKRILHNQVKRDELQLSVCLERHIIYNEFYEQKLLHGKGLVQPFILSYVNRRGHGHRQSARQHLAHRIYNRNEKEMVIDPSIAFTGTGDQITITDQQEISIGGEWAWEEQFTGQREGVASRGYCTTVFHNYKMAYIYCVAQDQDWDSLSIIYERAKDSIVFN
jgi:hypothetical protein